MCSVSNSGVRTSAVGLSASSATIRSQRKSRRKGNATDTTSCKGDVTTTESIFGSSTLAAQHSIIVVSYNNQTGKARGCVGAATVTGCCCIYIFSGSKQPKQMLLSNLLHAPGGQGIANYYGHRSLVHGKI